MLRDKNTPVVVSFVAFVAVLVCSENLFSNSFQKCISEYSASKAAIDTQNTSFTLRIGVSQIACTIHFINFHVGFFSIIAAGFAAYFAYNLVESTNKLWREGEAQRKQTDRALEIAERDLTISEWPYLYVSEPNFITRISSPPAQVPQFTCKITVHGKSPAIIRAYRSDLIFSEALPPAPPRDAGWSFRDGTCHPGFSIPGYANWENGPIPDKAETGIHLSAGKRYYAIFGVVYDDLFGHMHEVGFCYRGELGGGLGARIGGRSYNYHITREDKERDPIDRLLGGSNQLMTST